MSETLRSINLRLIDALRKIFCIQGSNHAVRITAQPRPEQILELIDYIHKDIWTSQNISSVSNLLDKDDAISQRVLYMGGGLPSDIQSFLARCGLISSIVLIPDQMAILAFSNPEHCDSPVKNPAAWIKTVIEWAYYLCSLEEWIRKGVLYLIPPLVVTNPYDWAKLGQSVDPSEIDEACKFNLLPTMVAGMRTRSGYIATFSKDSSLRKIHSKLLADDKALEELAIKEVNKIAKLTPEHIADYRKNARKPLFDYPIEQQIDFTGPNGNMTITGAGVAVTHLPTLIEKYKCIPITDQKFQRLMLEWYERKFSQSLPLGKKGKALNAITNLEIEVLNDVPLDFVLEVRESDLAKIFREGLVKKWSEIQLISDEAGFEHQISDYSQQIRTDFEEFKKEWKSIRAKALRDFTFSGITGAGTIAVVNFSHHWWLSLALPVAKVLYDISKIGGTNKLKLNHSYILLEIERKISN